MSASDSLADLLERIGSELDRVAGQLGRVAINSDRSTLGGVTFSPVTIVDMQCIDSSEQTLRSLASVLHRASRMEVASGRIDVTSLAADLPLTAVAQVIRGHVAMAQQDHGDVDLF